MSLTTSEVEICNQALASAVIRTQIGSLDDTTQAGKQCKLWFAMTRDMLLQEAPWGFCQSWKLLELVATAGTTWSETSPTPGFKYQYEYPTDALRVNIVLSKALYENLVASGAVRNPMTLKTAGAVFEISAGSDSTRVNTNVENAIAGFTERVDDVTRWSPLFHQTMVARLSFRLALALGGDRQLASANLELSGVMVSKAREGDGNEGLTVIDSLPDWQQIRDSGAYDTDWP